MSTSGTPPPGNGDRPTRDGFIVGRVVPPAFVSLENGDRLTRDEFERRYDARPDLKKAELIDGVVYIPSSARSGSRARPHAALAGWLFTYAAATPDAQLHDNRTIRLDLDNAPQPDTALLIDPAAGGQTRISGNDCIEGAPELVAEVAACSASYDLHDKLHAYRRNGVQEYLVWRTLDRALDWFELADGVYRPRRPDASGFLRSRVFPGLRLALKALLRGDLAAVAQSQRDGLGDPAHAAFVDRLRARKR